eukprot:5066949-Prymnesium_polylepis.1
MAALVQQLSRSNDQTEFRRGVARSLKGIGDKLVVLTVWGRVANVNDCEVYYFESTSHQVALAHPAPTLTPAATMRLVVNVSRALGRARSRLAASHSNVISPKGTPSTVPGKALDYSKWDKLAVSSDDEDMSAEKRAAPFAVEASSSTVGKKAENATPALSLIHISEPTRRS